MDIFKQFIEELRKIIREEIHNTIDETIKKYTEDKWMNKKQLAEYWGVSVSYINKNLDNIPHSVTTPIAFLRSEVDTWRKEGPKNLEVASNSKVSIKNYKSSSFKVGQ